jgi:uncharacterized membrane protein YdjX (TVP38/TMEM64 family)
MSRGAVKKLILAALVVGGVVLFFAMGWHRLFTLGNLQLSWGAFQGYYQAHPALVVAAYFLVYILVTSLSLPGATIMTLLGGALFGFWLGLVTISFASTIGATAACFVARFILGEPLQARYGDKLAAVNRGIEREGAFYLFTLRLVPLFPFFVINLVMGLTRLRLVTFYWVSQIGMLPGTAVYIFAGTQLGRAISAGPKLLAAYGIDRWIPPVFDVRVPVVFSDFIRGFMNWKILAAFILIGVFPLAAKRIIGWFRRRGGRRPASSEAA